MPPFSPGALVAAYLRDSGGDDQELSIDQQEAALREWCGFNNLVLTQIFKDQRTGSSTIGRTGFEAMMDYFINRKKQREAGIIVWKFSRLAREFDDAQFFKADLRRRGYIVHSLKDQIPDGLDGRLFEAALDWMNARYLKDLSEDVKRGLQHNLKAYGGVPGTPPRGFIRQPVELGKRRDGRPHIIHKWVPDPDTWERCRRAWMMRAQGASYKKIMDETRLYRSINCWATFFRNRIYLGELHYGGQVFENYVEPLISTEIWQAVQERNRKPLDKDGVSTDPGLHPRRKSSPFLLSGIVFCARCGAPLSGETSTNRRGQVYQSYLCTAKRRHRDCDAPHIHKEILEVVIWQTVKEHLLTLPAIGIIDKTRLLSDMEKAAEEVAALRQEIGTKKRMVQRLVDKICEGNDTPAMLERMKELEKEIAEAEWQAAMREEERKSRAPLSDEQMRQLLGLIENARKAVDPEMQKKWLRMLIEKIEVEKKDRTLRGKIWYYLPELSAECGDVVCPHRGTPLTHTFILSVGERCRSSQSDKQPHCDDISDHRL